MRHAVEHGAALRSRGRSRATGAHVARAALFYLAAQVEAGHGCPISMTLRGRAGAARAARARRGVGAAAHSRRVRPRPPAGAEKRGALVGMAMTERQGGSDVRANTTRARGRSAAASTSSRATSGSARRRCATRSSCSRRRRRAVVLPPAARAPRRHAQRLPHPAAEGQARRPLERVERDRVRRRVGAARRRGGPRRSRRSSRWSSTRGSTACSARRPACAQAVEQATHHAAHRVAFGSLLVDQPLMRNVLADLCVESEAATRARRCGSRARTTGGDDRRGAFARIATAVAKYWVCKRGPGHAAEALECLGGNGYVEESGLPRLYRAAAAPARSGRDRAT